MDEFVREFVKGVGKRYMLYDLNDFYNNLVIFTIMKEDEGINLTKRIGEKTVVEEFEFLFEGENDLLKPVFNAAP